MGKGVGIQHPLTMGARGIDQGEVERQGLLGVSGDAAGRQLFVEIDPKALGLRLGVFAGPVSLTFSFAQFGVPGGGGGTQTSFTTAQENAARLALQEWANVANITFTEVTATRYDKSARNFLAGLALAAIVIWWLN